MQVAELSRRLEQSGLEKQLLEQSRDEVERERERMRERKREREKMRKRESTRKRERERERSCLSSRVMGLRKKVDRVKEREREIQMEIEAS